ncbi:MAG: DNA-protecting protein DprA [Chitinophagaceae bacterium]|nr:DNA-protecting protein DprA [Oligoflexus sp.]
MQYSLSNQLEAIVTHSVSQLAYRWLPLPHSRPTPLALAMASASDVRVDPTQLSLKNWHEYIAGQRSAPLASAWVRVCETLQLSAIGLATVIFNNLTQLSVRGGVLIDYFHDDYPYLLTHIPDPPACLTCIGDTSLLAAPKLAIVGSRKASDFAFKEARNLALGTVQKGAVVVSGGAVGCDAAAHLGALDSGLRPAPTIVVFAGGLHKFYPQCLESLFGRLRTERALFVSERLWEYPARPMDFPIRNRIIAGLSSAIVVMQAAEKSGALKTASYALEQGREVYALVHEADDIRANGSRQLIEDGAQAFDSARDFLTLLPTV